MISEIFTHGVLSCPSQRVSMKPKAGRSSLHVIKNKQKNKKTKEHHIFIDMLFICKSSDWQIFIPYKPMETPENKDKKVFPVSQIPASASS